MNNNETIIKVNNIGKKYKLGFLHRHDTLRDKITSCVKKAVRGFTDDLRVNSNKSEDKEIWAVRGISFDVNLGDTIGIIGPNGAGKTTLLKILSMITEPTEGEIRIKGKVASLLEVGTGFHPELSGRENIFMNGSILGMTRAEIKAKFDEIVAFSGVEKFLDTPVKRYSSGMYVRLAFSVAAHLEPDILIVDEVLSVGDIEFQQKCLGKMKDVSVGGQTVLFVSHNMGAVQNLVKKCMLINNGKIEYFGDTSTCIQKYMNLNIRDNELAELTFPDQKPTNTVPVRIRAIRLISKHRGLTNTFYMDEQWSIEVCLCSIKAQIKFKLDFEIFNQYGVKVSKLVMTDSGIPFLMTSDDLTWVKVTLDKLRLYPGKYFVTVWAGSSETKGNRDFDLLASIISFDVIQGTLINSNSRNGKNYGITDDLRRRNAIFHEVANWEIK